LPADKDYYVICDFCGSVDEWAPDINFVYSKVTNTAICETCVGICVEALKEERAKNEQTSR
jgi:hypothetical protein